MKKLLAVLCAVCCLSAFSYAEGIQAGDQMVSGTIGFGTGVQDAGWKWNGNDVRWGSSGITLGLSYLFFPSEYFGAGVELNDGVFVGEDDSLWLAGNHYEMDAAMNVFNLMASFRANLNPQANTRFYFPFGIGLSSATQEITQTINGWKHMERATYNSLGWFVGLGFEIDLGQSNWSLGGEARYNSFRYNTDKIMNEVGGTGVGKKNYGYVSWTFKANYRF